MKKIILAVFVSSFIFCQSIFATSWGGLVTNVSKFSLVNEKIMVNQENAAFFNINDYLNSEKSLFIASEILFKSQVNVIPKKTYFKPVLDTSLCKFSGNFIFGELPFNFSVGRFIYSDISGVIFSQASDGLVANLKIPKANVNLGVYAGYTGLLNRLNVNMLGNLYEENDSLYEFCPKYIPILATFNYSIPKILMNIGVQADFFVSLEKYLTSNAYFTLNTNGAISTIGTYKVTGIFGLEDFSKLMIFASGDISFYLPNGIIGGGLEFASNSANGLASFTTITTRNAFNGFYENQTTSNFIPKINFSTTLSENLLITLNEKFVFLLPENGFVFRGLDTGLNLVYNIFSDLRIGCNLDTYFDFSENTNSNYYLSLNASFAF